VAEEGEVPELGADFFERARVRMSGEVVREADGTLTRRGRPPQGARAKVQQSLRLSPEVVDISGLAVRAGRRGLTRC